MPEQGHMENDVPHRITFFQKPVLLDHDLAVVNTDHILARDMPGFGLSLRNTLPSHLTLMTPQTQHQAGSRVTQWKALLWDLKAWVT